MPIEASRTDGRVFVFRSERRLVTWNDNVVLSKNDTIRMSFSGVTMIPSVCTDYACGTFRWKRVSAGSLNDYTYDVSTVDSVGGSTGYCRISDSTVAGPTIRYGISSTCSGSLAVYNPSVYMMMAGPNADKIIVEIWVFGNTVYHLLFGAVIDPCDFTDGVVADNIFTAGGCSTRPTDGSACEVYAYGGTVTLSRYCP